MKDTSSTHKIVELFLQHLSERDLDNLVQLFSEKVDWDIPGNEELAPWLGKRGARNEVKEFYELLWKNTEPRSAKISNILVDNAAAIISGEFSTRMLRTNRVVQSMFFIEIIVENSQISKFRLLEDSYAVSSSLTENS